MEDPYGTLQLSLPDSRYRYLIFCLSAMATACASEMTNSDEVVNECMNFLTRWAVDREGEFFGGPVDFDRALSSGITYIREFDSQWAIYVKLGEEGADNIDALSSMIHSTEATIPAGKTDAQRLEELALEVACRMPAMQGAFVELVSR